jgi:hypothetical protein
MVRLVTIGDMDYELNKKYFKTRLDNAKIIFFIERQIYEISSQTKWYKLHQLIVSKQDWTTITKMRNHFKDIFSNYVSLIFYSFGLNLIYLLVIFVINAYAFFHLVLIAGPDIVLIAILDTSFAP